MLSEAPDLPGCSQRLIPPQTLIQHNPAWRGSTGKYSTKQTAKKRYLPRVKRGVAAFEALGTTLTKAPPEK